ncbi:hypothetical protein [Paraclostridium sordellii]|uniref:hypothetical protein n=1 Tax=Paraclostridium sordellii TaxID=1505 RepID=UPI0013DEEF57|nr:hypothetical protein [Paeniclostridium sordellii]
MIIKILKEEDLELVKELPKKVKEVIKENVQILVQEYGKERSEKELGGFVVLVNEEGLVQLKEKVLKNTMPEYIDEIEGADYISALFLCGSDFSVLVICNKKLINILEQ